MNDKVILLVEDNPMDEKLTLLAFEKSNLLNPIVVARDGVEALDYMFARNQYEGRDVTALPQVILLDLKLPKIDGLEVLTALRADERTKLVPVVVLTSSNEDEDRMRSYSLGANSYIRKPVDFSQMQDAIKQLGLYWLLLNQAPPMPRR